MQKNTGFVPYGEIVKHLVNYIYVDLAEVSSPMGKLLN